MGPGQPSPQAIQTKLQVCATPVPRLEQSACCSVPGACCNLHRSRWACSSKMHQSHHCTFLHCVRACVDFLPARLFGQQQVQISAQ